MKKIRAGTQLKDVEKKSIAEIIRESEQRVREFFQKREASRSARVQEAGQEDGTQQTDNR